MRHTALPHCIAKLYCHSATCATLHCHTDILYCVLHITHCHLDVHWMLGAPLNFTLSILCCSCYHAKKFQTNLQQPEKVSTSMWHFVAVPLAPILTLQMLSKNLFCMHSASQHKACSSFRTGATFIVHGDRKSWNPQRRRTTPLSKLLIEFLTCSERGCTKCGMDGISMGRSLCVVCGSCNLRATALLQRLQSHR